MCHLGAELVSTTAQVTTRMLDSASAADMAALYASPQHPPLGILIYAGGVLRDGLLAKQRAGTLREVCLRHTSLCASIRHHIPIDCGLVQNRLQSATGAKRTIFIQEVGGR